MIKTLCNLSFRLLAVGLTGGIMVSGFPQVLGASEPSSGEKPAAAVASPAQAPGTPEPDLKSIPLSPASLPDAPGVTALAAVSELAKSIPPLLVDGKAAEAAAIVAKAAENGEPDGHFLAGWFAATGKATQPNKPDGALAEKHYRAGHEAGYAPSSLNLAILHLQSGDATKAGESVGILESLVEKDPKEAGFWLGYAYLAGAAGLADFQSAVEYWSRSAAAGNPEVQLHLGLAYSGAYGFPARLDMAKAASAWKAGAESGHAPCALRLGNLLLLDATVAGMKPEDAARFIQQASSAKLSEGVYLLAELKRTGTYGEPEKTPDAAAGLYQLAGEAGYAPALLRLADMLESGVGVTKDEPGAAKALQRAAQLGNPDACARLGPILRAGTHGQEKNGPLAARTFLAGAVGGNVFCAANLGAAYRSGDLGLLPDPAAARVWLEQAANAGEPNAAADLAEMIIQGQVPGARSESVRDLLISAASGGIPRAGRIIGMMMAQGQIFDQNIPLAAAWLEWASAGNDTQATEALAQLKPTLTPEQTEESKKLLENIKKAQK